MKHILIRKEQENEFRTVENLVREAFWDVYRPGCDEHLLVHRLRDSAIHLPELSFVAEVDGRIAGAIYYCKAVIKQRNGVKQSVLTFGPLAVAPEFQKQGIGKALIEHTVKQAHSLEYPAIVIYGSPAYYSRFGFEPGKKYGVTDAEGFFRSSLQLLPLKQEICLAGHFEVNSLYRMSPEEVRRFDAEFPPKQKHLRSSQIFTGDISDDSEEPIAHLAAENQRTAWDIIRNSGVLQAWESIGAEIRLVGSLRTGLLTKHRDLDLHIYTTELNVAESFRAMGTFAAKSSVCGLTYRNLADTEEACLEWHAAYRAADGAEWQLDMIQIRKGSRYDGFFERVAERIAAVLTPENRRIIQSLKYVTPENEHIMGIEYCRAVIEGGVKSWEEFRNWRHAHPGTGIIDWCP